MWAEFWWVNKHLHRGFFVNSFPPVLEFSRLIDVVSYIEELEMRSKRRVLTLLGIVLLMSAGVARADVIDFDALIGAWQWRSDSSRFRGRSPGVYAVTYGAQVGFNTTSTSSLPEFLQLGR